MKGPPKKDWDYLCEGSDGYVSQDDKPSEK